VYYLCGVAIAIVLAKITIWVMKKRIESNKRIREQIIATLGCSGEAIRYSLKTDRDTPLARAIRKEAIALGGRMIIEAPIEEVLTIEGDCLVWDRGNSKATIDLEHKVIIIKDGEDQEKKFSLTITNLIALIKEVKK
jgi:hypothetical protein